ncbi:MAG: TonB-dependent receptor, partial [Mucilaginibacter sp.]|nr:TonB-dependent receptor [Mucilaginibacter sp.]
KLGGSYNYYANYYADFNFSAVTTSAPINTWKVPNYGLVDLYGVFKFKFAGLDASLISNINNLLNAKYVSDAFDPTNSGQASTSTVFYGIGRVYSTTLKIKF